MFAVPGWSVNSSALKTQTAQPQNPITKATLVPATEEGDAPAARNRKRKRNGGKSGATEVDPLNFSDLWEKVIEGKPRVKADKSKSKEQEGEKMPKTQEDGRADMEVKPNHKTKKLKTMKEKKREKKAALMQAQNGITNPLAGAEVVTNPSPKLKPVAQLTPLQVSMRQKLVSARFRHLNQTLYTSPSTQSLDLFRENPEMFTEYHEGFRRQVEVWPENPVECYINDIKTRGKARRDMRGKVPVENTGVKPLPRTVGKCHIADLGCGDAGLATGLLAHNKKLNIQIYSFDLQSPSPLVTKADIASLPLGDDSVDIAIFCLALMGTNWIDFIEEAYRILHWKGELWIAEIKSRFGRVGGKGARVEHSVGNRKKPDKHELKRREEETDDKDLAVEVDGQDENKQETDVSAFVEVLRKRGFVLQGEVDLKNRMFAKMHFVKGLTPIKGKCVPVPNGMEKMGLETWRRKPKFIDDEEGPVSYEAKVLKPCVYKLR